jgi:hypothetical protein
MLTPKNWDENIGDKTDTWLVLFGNQWFDGYRDCTGMIWNMEDMARLEEFKGRIKFGFL